MSKEQPEGPVELECQFVLRLPEEPAKALREMLRSGATSLKDRFSIRLENDVRYGQVHVDNWILHAKVVDLPTIVESLKSIDNKSFYKTADICQMMICKEEDDSVTDEESPAKPKKKDPNKVDKKFLWPHGVTPPLKNVRKRRFRKTLKKKYVEAPEVEKEVKRLLRGDNDAVSVKWEVISEEDEKKGISNGAIEGMSGSSTTPIDHLSGVVIKEEVQEEEEVIPDQNTQTSVDVAEHDIFGEAVSDSDEEETHINIIEEESSRLSADDSRISDSMSLHMGEKQEDNGNTLEEATIGDNTTGEGTSGLVTEFSKGMFEGDSDDVEYEFQRDYRPQGSMSTEEIKARLEELRKELAEIKVGRDQQEMEVAAIENHALRQRFQHMLDSLLQKQLDKEQEFLELSELLSGS